MRAMASQVMFCALTSARRLKTLIQKALRRVLFAADALFTQGRLRQCCRDVSDSRAMLERQLSEQQHVLQQQSAQLAILQQTLNVVARRQGVSATPPIRVLFVIHNLNTWTSVAELIRRLDAHPMFEAIVASVNKRFPGEENWSGENAVHHFLSAQNVAHLRFNLPDDELRAAIFALAPAVLFRQSQWDNDYPPALRSEQLFFTRLAIVPYGIANLVENLPFHGSGNDSAVDSLFHRRCWRVYCANETVMAQARQYALFAGQQFRCTGHPRVNWLRNIRPAWPWENSGRRRVFWSPHHSVLTNWTNFGLFAQVWRQMLALFADCPTTDFVFSPHPALLTLLASPLSPLTVEELREFETTIASLPNVFRYEGGSYAEVAAACDVIVTDGISLLLEGQLLNIPLIHLVRQDSRPFNAAGRKIASGWLSISSVTQLADILSEWAQSPPEALLRQQRQNMEQMFPYTDAPGAIVNDLEMASLSEVQRPATTE